MQLTKDDEPLSPIVEHYVEATIIRDLVPPASVVHTKVGAAAIVGIVGSLLICGQFGLGLTEFARALSHDMHSSIGELPCALLCGALYAIFPVTILRVVFCSKHQFRFLVRRRWLYLLFWLVGVGATMALLGHHGTDARLVMGWSISAFISAVLLSRIAETLSWSPSWALTLDSLRAR